MRKFIAAVASTLVAGAMEASTFPPWVATALWVLSGIFWLVWLVTSGPVKRFVYSRPMPSFMTFLVAGLVLGSCAWLGARFLTSQNEIPVQSLTNRQLMDRTFRLVEKLRRLDSDYSLESRRLLDERSRMMIGAADQAKKDSLWQAANEKDSALSERVAYEFKTKLLGEAVSVRNELHRRVHPDRIDPKMDRYDHVFEYGSLAGASTLTGVANYLQYLAEKLDLYP